MGRQAKGYSLFDYLLFFWSWELEIFLFCIVAHFLFLVNHPKKAVKERKAVREARKESVLELTNLITAVQDFTFIHSFKESRYWTKPWKCKGWLNIDIGGYVCWCFVAVISFWSPEQIKENYMEWHYWKGVEVWSEQKKTSTRTVISIISIISSKCLLFKNIAQDGSFQHCTWLYLTLPGFTWLCPAVPGSAWSALIYLSTDYDILPLTGLHLYIQA